MSIMRWSSDLCNHFPLPAQLATLFRAHGFPTTHWYQSGLARVLIVVLYHSRAENPRPTDEEQQCNGQEMHLRLTLYLPFAAVGPYHACSSAFIAEHDILSLSIV